MTPPLYWIATESPGRLAVAARPRGGPHLDVEIEAWRAAGVDIVVSLLTGDEAAELGLTGEAGACEARGLGFLSLPVPDGGVPAAPRVVADLASALDASLSRGRGVVIHCRAGLGRAPLLAACVLVAGGLAPGTALGRIGASRGCRVPETAEQRSWVAAFAREQLAAGARRDIPKGGI